MSRLLADEIERLTHEDRTLSNDYKRAMKQALSLMNKGYKLGGKPLTREQSNRRTPRA